MMKKKLKLFFKKSLIYLSSNILNASIPFILLPIFSYYLSTDDYGRIAMFQILITGLNAIIGLNTVGAASRRYFDNDKSHVLVNYNNSSFIILFLSAIITVVAVIIFSKILVDFLSIPLSWIYLAVFCSAGNYIIQFRLVQFQIRQRALAYGVLQVSNSFFNFILSLILIIYIDMGVYGRVIAVSLSALFFTIYCLYSLKKEKLISFQFKKLNFIKDNLSFGIPLIPHVIGVFFLSSIDRFIINKKFGLSEAGIYMMAFQVSLALVLIYDSINKAFVPFLFSILSNENKNDDIKNKIIYSSYFLFLLCVLTGAIAYFISPYILVFISSEKYISATSFIGFLCVGQSFQGLYLIVTNYIFFMKKTKLLSLVTIVSGIVNIILIVLLIEDYGLLGVSISFCISMMIRFLLTWYLAQRIYPMPWNVFKLMKKNKTCTRQH